MAERSLYDVIMEAVNPLPREAEAASAKTVMQMLRHLNPAETRTLKGGSLRALEALTESYPAVKAAPVKYGKESLWHPPLWYPNLERWVQGSPYTKTEKGVLQTLTGREKVHPFGEIEIANPLPTLGFGHEAGHVLSGPFNTWAKKNLPPLIKTPGRASMEGFAEGLSNSMLDQFNAKAVTPYHKIYKNAPLHLNAPYTESGRLGVDVGADLRRGNAPPQEEIINELISILNYYL